MKRFLKLPSPAMAVALVALFTALAGSAYAATVITGANVKNGSLTGADVKFRGLEGSDIKDGALAARDIKAGTLTADRFKGGELPKGTRWLLVNRGGQIEAQSGGFSISASYSSTNGNVYINAGEDLSKKGISATIALENGYDLDGDGTQNGRATGADSNPEFSGEISASRCAIPGIVTCGPTGTNTPNHLVVSPRDSDGSLPDPGDGKKFYVMISD